MSGHFRAISSETEWEKLVSRYCPEALFQSWPWGEVQKRCGTEVKRFGLYRGHEPESIAQVTTVSAKRGKFLHVRHGPCFPNDPGKDIAPLLREWVDFLKRLAKETGAWFVRMNPLVPDSPEFERLFRQTGAEPSPIHRMDGEICWVLDLGQSTEDLLAGMRKSTRYDIRRTYDLGVTVDRGDSPHALELFLRLYADTADRQGFVGHRGIPEEVSEFGKRNAVQLYLGSIGGTTASGAIIIRYGSQAIYHHGASLRNKVPVPVRVLWEAIQDAKNSHLKVFNFWGVAPDGNPNHPWHGLTIFKQGFGGHEQRYIHAHDYPVHPLYSITRTVETVRRIRKGY